MSQEQSIDFPVPKCLSCCYLSLMTWGSDRVPAGVDDIDADRHAPGGRNGRRGGYRLLLGAGAGVVLLAAITVLTLLLAGYGGPARAPAAPPTPTATPTLAIPVIYQRLLPSMVVIRTPRELGAGFIVSDTGAILTANHVVAGAKHITVTFADGTTAGAAIVAADPRQDTATLRPAKLPQVVVPANLGGNPVIGTQVVAIGNPLGLDYSVSSGVVSGLNRTAVTHDGRFSGLIQFDAAVNAGSSGGPLVDEHGLVVGIVVSIADPAGNDVFAGIGFAAPVGTAIGGGGQGNGPQI
jgi:putative serine protease PepD